MSSAVRERALILVAILIAVILLSIFAVGRINAYTEKIDDQRAEEYSGLISHYLWTMNREAAEDFLTLIVDGDPIIKVKVYHADGMPFIAQTTTLKSSPVNVGWSHRTIRKDIYQESRLIGHFQAVIRRDATLNLYFALFNVMFGTGLYFYFVNWAKGLELANLSKQATTVLQGAAEGIMVMDGHRQVEAVNEAFTRITGFPAQDVIGGDTSFRQSGLHESDFYGEIEATLKKSGHWEGEVWNKRKNGEIYPEWLSVSLIRGNDGKPLHYISIFRDISEQKEAEAELIKVRNRLAEAEHIAEMGSWEWKVKENIYWWSDGIYRITGLDPKTHKASEEVFKAHLHPDDADSLNWQSIDYDSHLSERRLECRIIRPDKCVRNVEIVADFQRNADGKLLRVLGTVRDVTEAKQVERALREAKDKAETADSAKSRFLAAASHDLRQPLQALNLFVAALKQLVEMDQHPGTFKKLGLIGKIGNSLESLSDLLNALLDISRLDAGTLVPVVERFEADEVLDWVREIYSLKAQDAGLELVVVPSTVRIVSDPQLLKQLMGNLVANAIRYTNDGKVLVGCRRQKDRLVFQVFDTGVGIPSDQFGNIFREFHQLGNPERRREKGLGLGLSIVDRIARLMNHRVEVQSTKGQGSCFSIAVAQDVGLFQSPVADLESVDAIEKPMDATILVIEDEPVVLDGMCTILSQWGLTPLAAESAEQALEQCRRSPQKPAVILADYRLQENRTGAEAIRAVTEELGVPIPGVIITGDTGADRIQEAAASGFTLLHKPLKSTKLKEVLIELLEA